MLKITRINQTFNDNFADRKNIQIYKIVYFILHSEKKIPLSKVHKYKVFQARFLYRPTTVKGKEILRLEPIFTMLTVHVHRALRPLSIPYDLLPINNFFLRDGRLTWSLRCESSNFAILLSETSSFNFTIFFKITYDQREISIFPTINFPENHHRFH